MNILEQLCSDDTSVRMKGLDAIAATKDALVVDKLLSLAADPAVGGREREAVALALGKTGHEQAVGFLYECHGSDSVETREFAVIGLGGIADKNSTLALIASLEDSVNSVRNLAERSLMLNLEAVRSWGVEPLLTLLGHPVPLTRSPAARLLGLAKVEAAIPPLIQQLQSDRQWLGRMWAAKGLGDMGSAQPLAPLEQAFRSDEKNRVRAAAIEALCKLRPANIDALLKEALQDEDGGVKRLAEEWQSKIKQEPA